MHWCWSKGGLRFDEFSDAWRVAARQVQSLDAVRERQARAADAATGRRAADARAARRGSAGC